MGGRTAVTAAIALWLGLLAGRRPPLVLGALAGVVPLAWLAWRAPPRTGTLALTLALACAGTLRGAAHEAALGRARARAASGPELVRAVARVIEPPLRESGEPLATLRIERGAPWLASGARLRLRLPPGCDAEWGDRVRVLARLDRPRPADNPGGFDPREVADANALLAGGRAFAVTRERSPWLARAPAATAARWRRAIESRLAAGLSRPARELVVPLVTGDRTALPAEVSADFRASGLVHLLALSGLHVAWLAAVARGVCAAAGGGVRARAAAGAACALFYALIAGPLPSLLRAAVTEALVALARRLDLALDPIQALALTALGLLAIAPGWARDLGFQLSCAATLGLLALSPRLEALVPGRRAWHAAWATTLGAQVAAFPILAARMHALSWSGLIANLGAVPASSLLLAAAWLGAAAELVVPGAGHPFFSACEALSRLVRAMSGLAARLPGSLLALGAEPAIAACAAAGAALALAASCPPRTVDEARRPRSRARFAAGASGAFLLALAVLLGATARPLRPPPGRWWLVALDVGQGDALALGFRDGWWLVDTGPRTPNHDAGEAVVLPFLRWAGVRELGAVIVTHDDGDHTGGLAAVRRGVRCRAVLAPGALPRVAGPAARFGARALARGDRLRAAPPLIVRWPPRPADSDAAWPATDNAAALVIEAGEGEGRALLAADADSAVERALAVEAGLALLKVAHHGAASSSGALALAALRPRLAALSCGRRNPFGHPDPGALARLAAAGAIVCRTDEDGALWFELSEAGVTRVSWRRGELPRAPAAAPPPRAPRE